MGNDVGGGGRLGRSSEQPRQPSGKGVGKGKSKDRASPTQRVKESQAFWAERYKEARQHLEGGSRAPVAGSSAAGGSGLAQKNRALEQLVAELRKQVGQRGEEQEDATQGTGGPHPHEDVHMADAAEEGPSLATLRRFQEAARLLGVGSEEYVAASKKLDAAKKLAWGQKPDADKLKVLLQQQKGATSVLDKKKVQLEQVEVEQKELDERRVQLKAEQEAAERKLQDLQAEEAGVRARLPKEKQPQAGAPQEDEARFKEALAAWAEAAGYGKMVNRLFAPGAGDEGRAGGSQAAGAGGGQAEGARSSAGRRNEGGHGELEGQGLAIVEVVEGFAEQPSSKKRRHLGVAAFEVDDFDVEDPDQVAKVRLLAARIEAAQQDGRVVCEQETRPRSPAK